MTDRELMQQALELLNDINQCSLPPTRIPLPAEIDHVMEALQDRLEQPEREWQGLTDEEIKHVNEKTRSIFVYARAIEAKLKEKNGF